MEVIEVMGKPAAVVDKVRGGWWTKLGEVVVVS